jgi:hypothetical protein
MSPVRQRSKPGISAVRGIRHREENMSNKVRQNLDELTRNIQDNAHCVEKKLSTSGTRPDRAVVISAAKYHDALERLSKE